MPKILYVQNVLCQQFGSAGVSHIRSPVVEQLEPLYSVIEYTKIPMIKLPGYEADDIMGTLA
ncbi:MAG TPA: hypothetical protein EYQ86_06465, partial [Bacteroidetes bacterium]|nr:hypothetical protein [Bacteroidota bacterium]